MENTPSAEAPESDRSFYHKAANYAVWAFALSVAFNLVAPAVLNAASVDGVARRILQILPGIVLLSAVPAGIIALVGIRQHGREYLLWRGIVGTVVPLLLVALAIPAFEKVRSASRAKSVETAVKQFADGVNSKTPKMVDEATRMEGATIGPATTVTIKITAVTLKATDVSQEKWAKEFSPTLRAAIEKSGIVPFVKNGATLVYRYVGNDGVTIGDIVFRPEDYPDTKAN